MTRDAPQKKPAKTGKTREDRLKTALKANLARRKAQGRARDVKGTDDEQNEG